VDVGHEHVVDVGDDQLVKVYLTKRRGGV
jgi:hypothetical protein